MLTQLERLQTFRALDTAHQTAFRIPEFSLRRDRYVIFSDAHMGDRRPTLDEFQPNENLFCHALRYYLDHDYGLIINGDMEEGWKNSYREIMSAYESSIYALESEFARQGERRHLRIRGNHDDAWQNPARVDKHLGAVLKTRVRVHPAVLLGDRIMLAHGHQGEPNADFMAYFSRLVVRYLWRPVQRIRGRERLVNGAHNMAWKRREHYLYEWAQARRMLLIAGHTHRPMFHDVSPYVDTLRQRLSMHLERVHDYPRRSLLTAALHTLDRFHDTLESIEVEAALSDANVPAFVQMIPCYLNSGSCLSRDGITGIEIDRGIVRLIRWEQTPAVPRRLVHQSGELDRMLAGI